VRQYLHKPTHNQRTAHILRPCRHVLSHHSNCAAVPEALPGAPIAIHALDFGSTSCENAPLPTAEAGYQRLGNEREANGADFS